MLFGPEQIACTRSAFQSAERLTGKHFGFGPDAWLRHTYDVRTLALLREYEVNSSVFAQLFRYGAGHPEAGPRRRSADFYRVCIQDNRVLDAVRRSGSFIRLMPLMLYIAVHELIHIVRFCRGESDFDMPAPERIAEEKRVHEITRQALRPVASPELDLVLQCFSDDYVIEGIYN